MQAWRLNIAFQNARLRREQKDYPHSTEVASPPSPLSPSQTLSTSTPFTGSRWAKFFLNISYSSFAAEVKWVFWATVSSERPAFCLLCWYCRISVLFFQIYLRYKTRYYFSKNIRNMRALIFPRVHQRPAHEPTVGGQPTPQNGRSGPSGTQVVIQTTHKINLHAHCQIFPEEKICS